MLTLNHVPLAIYNRALELFGLPPEDSISSANDALFNAEARLVVNLDNGFTPFAQAVAEHLSSEGPLWTRT